MTEVEQLMAIQAKEKGVKLRFRYDLPLPEKIHNDPTRLKQVLFNLISNALKFTREGEVNVTLSCHYQQEELHVSVQDNGIGLSKDQIDHLFQPYMQAKKSTSRQYGGTGLGLMIARRLVNLMGGDIEVDSKMSEGSVFTFSIVTGDLKNSPRLTEIKNNDLSIDNVSNNIPTLSGKILLVEDIADNQKLISMYLRQAGLDIDIADNGKDGFNKALNENYQLILMDIQMPIMDGLTATQYLREADYTAPIIALTANVLKNERETYLEAGFDDILTKPIILDEFYSSIKKWLKSDSKSKKVVIKQPGNDSFQTLVQHFLHSLADELETMDTLVPQSEWLNCQKILHNIKGRGGSFGFPELTHLASELEALLKDKQYQAFQNKYTEFKRYSQTIIVT
ncbi:ATP-binding protein [sulfur-oxidizing endosymbiont of Gigantopelta aegis]|uniref:ATP-binding protein n=1 Tax=sulfur-oxidizing endosymbiont of Gigantopelta aegis TaxID=2794934 RepID=UPI0018DD51C3|nr:ATP-binding protein [sulfur-oxidizing endosymbiont of Gigantopelta aegis]